MKHRASSWVLLAALIWGSFGGALLSVLPHKTRQSVACMPCCLDRTCTMHPSPAASMPESCDMASHRSSQSTTCACSISESDTPQFPTVLVELRFDLTRASILPQPVWSFFQPDPVSLCVLTGYSYPPDQPPEGAA